MTFQPMIGNGDAPQDLYYVSGAEHVGRPDLNESNRVAWVALDEAEKMIGRRADVGAATVMVSCMPRLSGVSGLNGSRVTGGQQIMRPVLERADVGLFAES